MHSQIHAKTVGVVSGLAEQQEHFRHNQRHKKQSKTQTWQREGGAKQVGEEREKKLRTGQVAWEADVVAARGWERGRTVRLAVFSVSEVVLSAFTESLCSPHSGTWGDFGLSAPPPVTAARLAAKSHAQINSRLLRSLNLD